MSKTNSRKRDGATKAQASTTARSARNRRAALILHAHHDTKAFTLPARTAFLERFLHEVDARADGPITAAERVRRAERLKRAYFIELSAKAAAARSRRANGTRTSIATRIGSPDSSASRISVK